MLNASDVKTLREKGMSNMDILKNMGRVVPSAQRSYNSIVSNQNIPEWQKESMVGKMLDKKTPVTAPSGMGYMAASAMNDAQSAYINQRASLEQSFLDRLGSSIRSIPSRVATSFGTADDRAKRVETSKGFDIADIPGDIADVAGAALPVAGSIIGGIVGGGATIPTGPGAIAGAGVGATVGAGIGEAGRQAVGRMLGQRQGETIGQELGGIAKEGAISGVGEVVGGQLVARPLAFAGRKLLAPFTSLFDSEIASLAARKGVKLPVSAMTEQNAVRIGETVASKGLAGAGVETIVNEANSKVLTIADDIVKKIGGSDDLMTAGKSIVEGADNFRSIWTTAKNKLYKAADALIGQRPKTEYINVEATKSLLDNILSSKAAAGEVLGDSVVRTRLQVIRRNLDKRLSINTLSSALTELNQITQKGIQLVTTGDEAALRKVAATLSSDLDSHIARIVPEIGDALSKADGVYKNGIELLHSKVGDNVGKLLDSPERILDSILRPNAASDAKRLIKLIGGAEGGAERIANVRSAFARKLVDEATSPKTGNLMGGRLASILKKYGTVLDEIFDEETAQSIREVSKLALAMDKSQVVAQGSNTAFSSKIIALVGAIATGNFPAAAGIAASDIGLSKIFTTDIGRKWLTTGFKAPPAITEPVKNVLATGAKQAINATQRAISK